MENSYGIGVTNRYELFYDEDVDPMDLISQTVAATEKENKTKGGVKAGKVPAGKKAGKTEINNKIAEKIESSGVAGRGRGGPDNRVKFSDREERNNRRNRPEGDYRQPGEFRQGGDFKQGGEFRDGERPAPRFDGERGRGRGRGMGRGRGRGRGAGPDGRDKREFDRRSGSVTSGVKSVDKRDGSGSYNWGSDKELVEENMNASTEISDHDTSAENAEKLEDGAAPAEGEEAKTEEETAREMTLDEYKAMQKAAKANKPTFNVRKAGEGENQTQWKKTYVLKKKVEEAEEEDDEEDDEEAHHGRRKVVLDIDFQFSDSPARGRGRGRGRGGDRGRGRGGDRGGFERRGGMGGGRGEGRGMDNERGRGRGGARGGRGRQEAPKMDDERDFPSLG